MVCPLQPPAEAMKRKPGSEIAAALSEALASRRTVAMDSGISVYLSV